MNIEQEILAIKRAIKDMVSWGCVTSSILDNFKKCEKCPNYASGTVTWARTVDQDGNQISPDPILDREDCEWVVWSCWVCDGCKKEYLGCNSDNFGTWIPRRPSLQQEGSV